MTRRSATRVPLVVACLGTLAFACAWGAADRLTRVAEGGILRWQDDGSEVALFGVNYCVPFCLEYSALGELGLDRQQVIDQDVQHLARLGLTCMRMPVWDREISDAEGNLIETEHLRLLDHLIAEGKRRGLYMVLTPQVWYPTKNASPGFATRFTMEQMTGDAGEPRRLQCRYLSQFVQHCNQETGLTYAEDPAVLAFELINEPLYAADLTDAQVTAYIEALAQAVRATGCRKPLFYNGWFGHAKAVAASSIEGMTFGCYPTGLVAGRMLEGNHLGQVDEFPALHDEAVRERAKGVYEFDAADVPWGCMYPAMARMFRAGGVQFANQFQYDAWPLAASNACWQTHFLSLPHTPGKAVSLLIAAEAFRRLPRLSTYPHTPAGDCFGPFRVSYEERLSEMLTETEFLYSNDTRTVPPAPALLSRLVGVGSSALVSYAGSGAYFLERLAAGVWRLEVYPDCVWVADPFAAHDLGDETSRILWAERRMELRLPDLGGAFTAAPVDHGNVYQPQVQDGAFEVRPGVYRLARAGAPAGPEVAPEFFAPPAPARGAVAAWHAPPDLAFAGQALQLTATCTEDSAALALRYRAGTAWRNVPMARQRAYSFAATIPAADVVAPELEYAVLVPVGAVALSFPGGRRVGPEEEDAKQPSPPTLFDASRLPAAPAARLVHAPGGHAETALADGALRLVVSGMDPQQDSVGEVRAPATPVPTPDYAPVVRLRARRTLPGTTVAQVTLMQSDGRTYATNLPLATDYGEVDVPVSQWWPCWQTSGGRLDPGQVREVSVAIGTWLFKGAAGQPHGLEIASITLTPPPGTWAVPVQAAGLPVALLPMQAIARRNFTPPTLRAMVVKAPDGREALELSHPGFGPPPDCAVVSWTLPALPPAQLAALGTCDTLRLTLRRRSPAATALQVGLTEADGAPWGVDISVPPEWQTVDVPLRSLQFFGHWAHPEGRGGEGDRLHPERLQSCTVAFGAWQHPAQAAEPHALQIRSIEMVHEAP